MDDKKDALVDEAAGDASESEAVSETLAADAEAEAPAADVEDAASELEAEAAVADQTEAEAEVETETVEKAQDPDPAEDVKEAEEVALAEAQDAPETDTPAPSKKVGWNMGDLVAVGILSIVLGVLLALPSFLGVTSGGGSGSEASGSAAATVNGSVITEEQVTNYIMDFRTKQGLSNDADWGEWMVGFGYDAKGLRSDTIDYFVERELLKQAVAEQGIEVEDSAVEEYIATITEQVGGETAFTEALEAEGLTLDTYREEVKFSLQQQELAQKVANVKEQVDDAEVLELVKLYFPDSVDENATSLDGVDQETVNQIRSMLESTALQQAFSEWMDDYRGKASVVIVDMPASLPYAIDLTPYQKAQQENEDAEEGVIELEDDESSSGSSGAASSDSGSAKSEG